MDVEIAARKLCSVSVQVSGKSGSQKCDQQYIGAAKTVQIDIPDNNKHNYCKGVKLLAIQELRNSLPADQTGCLIDSSKPCSGC